jgi:hypothetical protein
MELTDLFRLDGKVAVVTGASYGLGVLFADILASAGADVVVTADVTVYDDCERVVTETMTELGRVDILVNYFRAPGRSSGVRPRGRQATDPPRARYPWRSPRRRGGGANSRSAESRPDLLVVDLRQPSPRLPKRSRSSSMREPIRWRPG